MFLSLGHPESSDLLVCRKYNNAHSTLTLGLKGSVFVVDCSRILWRVIPNPEITPQLLR